MADDMTLREALTDQLGGLPLMTYANGYRVQALPKATLLDLLAQHPEPEPADVDLRALIREADEFCCPDGCGSGACESCPCCLAGWCVGGNDGLPDGDPEDLAHWLDIAKQHNPLVAALVAAGMFREAPQLDQAAAGTAAAKAIIYNLPVDGFGQPERLEEWAAIWGNAAATAVLALIGGDAK